MKGSKARKLRKLAEIDLNKKDLFVLSKYKKKHYELSNEVDKETGQRKMVMKEVERVTVTNPEKRKYRKVKTLSRSLTINQVDDMVRLIKEKAQEQTKVG